MKIDREHILLTAHKVAAKIAKNEFAKGNLADELLATMADALENGVAIDLVWAEIAERGGYADKANKLEGVKMPSTLATYRSKHRKGQELGVPFRVTWPEFQKSLKPQLDQSNSETETEGAETEKSEPKKLETVVIAEWLAEIANRHHHMKSHSPMMAAKFAAEIKNFAEMWDGGE
jgi:hypothetical protein